MVEVEVGGDDARVRRPSPITAVLVATALAAVINLATGPVDIPSLWQPWVGALAGLLVVVSIVVEWRDRRSQATQPQTLDQEAERLAGQVREQWNHEAELRRLRDPMPLSVRWSSTRRPVAADRSLVLDSADSTSWELLPLSGDAEKIVEAFLGLPHGRLVALGEPGAGKSVLAILLTLGLLQHRTSLPPDERAQAPVPVLVPIASWNPHVEQLGSFLLRRLGEEYPQLLHTRGDGSVAAELLAGGRLVPILDGLDELPAPAQPVAVTELNAYMSVGRPLVVTCRSREYEKAVTQAGTELARAAVVELQPVAVDQIITFLSQPKVARPRWQPVFDHLRAHPNSALSVVLSTPLMTALARFAFSRSSADPGNLMGISQVSTIRKYLMDRFVDTAFLNDRPKLSAGKAVGRYRPELARRWLGYIAYHLSQRGQVDWWWWQLTSDILLVHPRRAKVLIALGAYLLTVATMLGLVAMAGLWAGLSTAVALMILITLQIVNLWRPLWPGGFPPLFGGISLCRLRLLWMAFWMAGSAATGLALSAPMFGLFLGLAVALPIGVLVGRISWLPAHFGSRQTAENDHTRHGQSPVSPRATFHTTHHDAAAAAIRHGIIAAVVAGAAATVLPEAPDPWTAALVAAVTIGLNAGLAAGWRTWARYRLIHAWLAARGLLPWRLWRFLRDAHQLGVLRQAGTTWQFRHLLLQNHLASTIRSTYLRDRADAGDWQASWHLAQLLTEQGQVEEALTVLRPWADSGKSDAAEQLAKLLAGQGQVEELRSRADAGDWHGSQHLAKLLAGQGQVEELRSRADAGNRQAAWHLAELLAEQGQEEELRARSDAGDWEATRHLVRLLTKQDRVDEALTVLRSRSDAGDWEATRDLEQLLTKQDRVDEALTVLRSRADAGDPYARLGLGPLLAKQGRVEELRSRVDAGDRHAQRHLTEALAGQGRVEELRSRADAGDWYASEHLAKLLARQGRVEELRSRVDAGDEDAQRHLAKLLAGQGRVQELRSRADAGDRHAQRHLAEALARQGEVDGALTVLRPRADAGDWNAQRLLAELLAKQGRVEELRSRADAGDWYASEHLAKLLAKQGRVEELRSRADTGDLITLLHLAKLLARQGRVEEALTVLWSLTGAGYGRAVLHLAELLTWEGQVEEALAVLRSRADDGDWYAARDLAKLLAKQGQVEEALTVLRPWADSGNSDAARDLAELLEEKP